jgi:diguanylate cyclase (GGDEF)-like protein
MWLIIALSITNLMLAISVIGLFIQSRLYAKKFGDRRRVVTSQMLASSSTASDFLTKNRQLFLSQVQKKIDAMGAEKSLLAFLYIDLDDFKKVNDALGYELGDLFLEQFLERLYRIIWTDKIIERVGGDDFVIFLFGLTAEKQVMQLVQTILQELSKELVLNGENVTLSASIGISFYPQDGQDPGTLLKNANIAMYDAKRLGKNSYSFYNTGMDKQSAKQHLLEGYLRKALEKNELSLFYQPKVDLKTNKIIGAEALIRWRHPELGMIAPTEFISIAEKTGLVIAIGNWIVKNACSQTKIWHNMGFNNFVVAINLSAYQFRQGDISHVIAETLWETGLTPSALDLEITESVIMENPEKSVLMLHVLRSMGVSIAIDDFGTGYSSLTQLKSLPFQSLKIDQSFVRNLETDPAYNRTIIATIVSMAKQLGLKIIAEGVETEEQRQFLLDQGCDYGQGYLFSKPLEVGEMTKLLQGQQGQSS